LEPQTPPKSRSKNNGGEGKKKKEKIKAPNSARTGRWDVDLRHGNRPKERLPDGKTVIGLETKLWSTTCGELERVNAFETGNGTYPEGERTGKAQREREHQRRPVVRGPLVAYPNGKTTPIPVVEGRANRVVRGEPRCSHAIGRNLARLGMQNGSTGHKGHAKIAATGGDGVKSKRSR